MRSVLFLLMLIPFAIGNSAFAEIYSNNDYSFSIYYPDQWIHNDEILVYDDGRISPVVFFSDNDEWWITKVQIDLIEDSQISSTEHNEDVFDILENKLERSCQNASQEIEGFICSDFKLFEMRVLIIDGIKSYQLAYSWTEYYSDDEIYKNISYYTVIPKNENTWTIFSNTLEEYFPEHSKAVQDMINSFQVNYATEIIEDNSQFTLDDDEKSSFITLIITTINSMLNLSFELAEDPTLQGWGNDVIKNVAEKTESKIVNQLGYDPTSLEEVNAHLNSKSNTNDQQPKESLSKTTPNSKRQPLPNSEPQPLPNSEPQPLTGWELAVVESKQYPKTITYTYGSLPSGIDKNIILDATVQAFRNWETSNPELEFEYSKNLKSDILIKWQIYSNPDHDGLATITLVNDEPIIGKGTITASIGSVNCRGEYVQHDSGRMTNISMHEIGHIMGLSHHMEENHLMYGPDFTDQTKFDTMGYEIPKRLDDWFVGQGQLVEKADSLKKEYDAIYSQYKKYEGKLVSQNEYATVIALHSQLTEINDERNKILQKLDCYPNFSVLEP